MKIFNFPKSNFSKLLIVLSIVGSTFHSQSAFSYEFESKYSWKTRKKIANQTEIDRQADRMTKLGSGRLAAETAASATAGSLQCALNGVVLVAQGSFTSVPLFSVAGLAIAVLANPDFSSEMVHLSAPGSSSAPLYFGGTLFGGIITGIIETPIAAYRLARGNGRLYPVSREVYSATSATANALFSKASDCSYYFRKTGVSATELGHRISGSHQAKAVPLSSRDNVVASQVDGTSALAR